MQKVRTPSKKRELNLHNTEVDIKKYNFLKGSIVPKR